MAHFVFAPFHTDPPMNTRLLSRTLFLSATIASTIAAQAKPLITPKDYGKWELLGATRLSPKGDWLAYSLNRVNEENELRIRGGAKDTTIVAQYGLAPAFSADDRWISYSIGVSPSQRDRLQRDKKPIRNSL